MKKNFLFAALLLFTFLIMQAQTKAEKRALRLEKNETAFNEIKTLIESGTFQFEALSALPIGNDIAKISAAFVGGGNVFQGNRVDLTGNSNFIRINNQASELFLPYFGRVYRTPNYNKSASGLEFKGDIEDYIVEYNDSKHKIDIKFTVNKPQEQLQFHLVTTAKGDTSLNVNSSNRQSIRYLGKVKVLDKKEVASK